MVTTTTDPLSGMTFDHRTIIQGIAPSYLLVAVLIGVLVGALIVLAALRSSGRIRSATRR